MMNSQTFDRLIERRIGLIRQVLISKNKEYNSGDDKLSNFKRSADLANEAGMPSTAAHEAAGFLRKHIISVFDLINKHAAGDEILQAVIDEKLGDTINYVILIEALLNEGREFPEVVPVSRTGIPELDAVDPDVFKTDTTKPAGIYGKERIPNQG